MTRSGKPASAVTSLHPDRYYLVKPLLPGPARAHIDVRHIGGTERVNVELIAREPKSRLLEYAGGCAETGPQSVHGHKRSEESAMGYSQNFSMDEAFNDALSHLPIWEQNPAQRQLKMVDVVSMGAIYGGFFGFSRLFVKVERTIGESLPQARDERSLRK